MFLDGHYFNYIAINDVLLLESLDLSSFFLLASSERWTFTGHSRLLRSAGPDEATRQPRRRTKVALLVRAQGERKEGRKEGGVSEGSWPNCWCSSLAHFFGRLFEQVLRASPRPTQNGRTAGRTAGRTSIR